MVRLLLHLAILALASQPLAAAQSSLTSVLSELPNCALTCLVTAVSHSTCAPTNQTCLCTNQPLQDEVTLCVSSNCTILEALDTKNLTETSCGAPIRDRSGLYNRISTTFGVISAIFVVTRIGFKLLVTHSELGLDDLFIVITLFAGIPSSVINVQGLTKNGLGRDVWTVERDRITRFGEFFYVMEVLYFAQVALLKLSLLFFYLRVFPGRRTKLTLWSTVVFDCLFGTSFVFVAIFQCTPISYYWTQWDELHQGTCLNVNAIGWANAGISIALDAWMLAIPLFQVRRLKLHWKKKIGVAMMFCVATFVTVVSILRLHSLVAFANSVNPTWDNFDVANWSTIEINVGIMCACMPAMRLILVHFFPRIMGSTRGGISSKGRYYVSAGDGVNIKSTARSNVDSGLDAPPGKIMYSKSFGVGYADNDEISLVRIGNVNEDLGSTPTISARSA